MRKTLGLFVWALILLIGATAAGLLPPPEPHHTLLASAPGRALTVAQLLSKAQLVSPPLGAEAQRLLASAANLRTTDSYPRADATSPLSEPRFRKGVATIAAPDGAERLLRVAMTRAPALPAGRLAVWRAPRREGTALAALEEAAPSALLTTGVSAYGELEPDVFATHRLTILQLGDSHTAADIFTGRVRERLQQAFGTGGDAYIVPGKPHVGVRSALFESDATDGWSYEALQKSDDRRRFYLSGFNAIARRAGAALSLRSRGGRSYDRVEVAFLKQPGGGQAEVLIDGAPTGSIDLDGAADERATLSLRAPVTEAATGFREIAVRSLSDAPVTVTGVDVGREGDGVSFISLGFPGATVQLLQRLTTENLADDLRRMAPDMVVLAFGTNEGFNDNLDIATYTAQYEQIVRKLREVRPGVRVVIIGPPDAARPSGACHGAGVGQDCVSAQPAQIAAGPGGGLCRFPTPPKLGAVREAQRKLAERLGATFWDWSSVMPGPCGAQAWAAANPPLMAHDYVHMTLDGYRLSADRFADFLIPLIEGRPAGAHVVSND